jgi:hypothetical protein
MASLAAGAAVLGVAAPAHASNVELLGLTIRWAAVMEKDAGALGPAVDKGPSQADAAALKLEKDAAAAARAVAAVKPSSATGVQLRNQLTLALQTYEASGRELHFAVAAAQRNDAKSATSHITKAVSLAKVGSAQMTKASQLLRKLKL